MAAFDLVGERRRTSHRIDHARSRSKKPLEERTISYSVW
jgi:hypothetical protein